MKTFEIKEKCPIDLWNRLYHTFLLITRFSVQIV
nr:MAG TPA: hypothetical protein [Caudoviricetes sp.]